MSSSIDRLKAVRALLARPDVDEGLRASRLDTLPSIKGALLALAEPDSVLARFSDPVIGNVQMRAYAPGRDPDDPHLTYFLDRLASLLTIAMSDVRSSERAVGAAAAGGVFNKLASACAADEARRGSVLADTDGISRLLYAGLTDESAVTPSVADARYVRAGLSAEGSAKLSSRMKDLNAFLFAPACIALADRGRALSASSPLPELGPIGLSIREQEFVPDFVSSAVRELPREGLVRMPRRFELGGSSLNSTLPGAVVTALPVGNWPNGDGERLAAALLRATHLMMGVADTLEPMLATEAHLAALGNITFQRSGQSLMREGVATTAQAIALLLAQPPADMSLDRALELLQHSPLVTMVALGAPIGVIAPFAVSGWVPSDPITVGDGGRLLMPTSLKEVLRRIHAGRVLPSRDTNDARATFGMHDLAPNANETMRGCPVAGRVAVSDGKGGAVLGEKTPVQLVSEVMLGLVRDILRGPPLEVRPRLDLSKFR